MIDADFISDRIAILRTEKNISARDMSLSLGQSQNYINNIEKQSYQNSNNDHKQYHSDNQQYKHKNGYALRSLGVHILFRRYYPTITI